MLGYTEEPLASCDFNHDPRSGIVDASQTRVSQQKLVKVLIWFDNEWGYANRMLDTSFALVLSRTVQQLSYQNNYHQIFKDQNDR